MMTVRIAMRLLVMLSFSLSSPAFDVPGRNAPPVNEQARSGTISGRYVGTIKGPAVGEMEITLLVKQGSDAITGTVLTPVGQFPITSGSYAEGQLVLKFMASGDEVTIHAAHQQDRLTGSYTIGKDTGTVDLTWRDATVEFDPKAVTRLSKSDWREDLQYFARELPKRHKNAFHHITRAQFDRAVDALDRAIPALSYYRIIVGMQQITAMIGDGHTYVAFPDTFHRYPLTLYWFGNDLRVIKATAPYRDLLGSRVVGIGTQNIREIERRVRRVFSQDENEWFVRSNGPGYILIPEVLQSLGIVSDIAAAPFTLEDDSGSRSTRVIVPVGIDRKLDWIVPMERLPLYLQKPEEPFWFTYLPETQTVYVNFRSYDALEEHVKPLFAFLDQHPATRLIIDMRQNGGGDFTLVRAYLIPGIKQRPAINRRGHLFVITGRRTFSAAMSNTADFRQRTNALLVGEPPGERPNSYQERRQMLLPHSNLMVSYSVEYYKFLNRDVPAILPDKRIDPDWNSYRAGEDPVLNWILAYRP